MDDIVAGGAYPECWRSDSTMTREVMVIHKGRPFGRAIGAARWLQALEPCALAGAGRLDHRRTVIRLKIEVYSGKDFFPCTSNANFRVVTIDLCTLSFTRAPLCVSTVVDFDPVRAIPTSLFFVTGTPGCGYLSSEWPIPATW